MDVDPTELEDHELDSELADAQPEVVDREPDPDADGGDDEVKP